MFLKEKRRPFGFVQFGIQQVGERRCLMSFFSWTQRRMDMFAHRVLRSMWPRNHRADTSNHWQPTVVHLVWLERGWLTSSHIVDRGCVRNLMFFRKGDQFWSCQNCKNRVFSVFLARSLILRSDRGKFLGFFSTWCLILSRIRLVGQIFIASKQKDIFSSCQRYLLHHT